MNNKAGVMEMLAAGIPVTLLMDLSARTPIESHEIYQSEGGDAGWLAHAV